MSTAAANRQVEVGSRTALLESATPFAAAMLVLTASLANFLSYHSYSFARAEVAIVLAGLALLSAIYGVLYLRSKGISRALAEAVLVYFAVDLNSDHAIVAAIAAVVAGAVRHRAGFSLLPIISIMAGVVLLSGLAGLSEQRPPIARAAGKGEAVAAAGQPAILHVILDEHAGLAGIPDTQVRAALADLYRRHGFRTFARAYSRHFHTVNAIPDMLNFGGAGESRSVSQTLDIGRTAYLSSLEERSYRLHFYQSEFADFCRYSAYASCTRYWSPSLSFVEPLPISAEEKARLMAYKFIALSGALTNLSNLFDLASIHLARDATPPLLNIKQYGLSGTLGALAALDRLTFDLQQAQPGEAYFAHLLLPHYPYTSASDCRARPPSRWEYRRSLSPLAARRSASHEQLLCTAKRLDTMIGAFLRSPAGRSGVIVIHGDHGSRITQLEPTTLNRRQIPAEDMIAGYSTLFAVRSPHVPAGIEERPFAAPDILAALSRTGHSSLDQLKPGSGLVFLDGPNWTVGAPASINNAWPPTGLSIPQP